MRTSPARSTGRDGEAPTGAALALGRRRRAATVDRPESQLGRSGAGADPTQRRGSIGGGAAPRRHGPRAQGTGAPAAAALSRAAGARRESREMSINLSGREMPVQPRNRSVDPRSRTRGRRGPARAVAPTDGRPVCDLLKVGRHPRVPSPLLQRPETSGRHSGPRAASGSARRPVSSGRGESQLRERSGGRCRKLSVRFSAFAHESRRGRERRGVRDAYVGQGRVRRRDTQRTPRLEGTRRWLNRAPTYPGGGEATCTSAAVDLTHEPPPHPRSPRRAGRRPAGRSGRAGERRSAVGIETAQAGAGGVGTKAA